MSGNDVDKWKATGLTPVKPSKVSVPLIDDPFGNVEYRVIQQIPFDDQTDLFVGEALATHVKKEAMEGKLYRSDSNPLLYMGTKYDAEGKSLGKFYTHVGKVERADYESSLLKACLGRQKRR